MNTWIPSFSWPCESTWPQKMDTSPVRQVFPGRWLWNRILSLRTNCFKLQLYSCALANDQGPKGTNPSKISGVCSEWYPKWRYHGIPQNWCFRKENLLKSYDKMIKWMIKWATHGYPRKRTPPNGDFTTFWGRKSSSFSLTGHASCRGLFVRGQRVHGGPQDQRKLLVISWL